MITDKKFNQAIWWVLQEINKESIAKHENDIRFEYRSSDNNFFPMEEDQRRAINFLKKEGVIATSDIYCTNTFDNLVAISTLMFNDKKPLGHHLEIFQPKFDKLYKKFAKKFGEKNQKINKKVEFLDNEAALKVGDSKCKLPPFGKEHMFCRATFNYLVNEPVDWSEIAESTDMEIKNRIEKAESKKAIGKIKKRIYDTIVILNKRALENFGIEKLFIWKNKTIRRTQ